MQIWLYITQHNNSNKGPYNKNVPGGYQIHIFARGKNLLTPPKLQGKNRGTPPLNSREKIEGPPLIVGKNPSTPL